jgi:PTS system fructose-specific IIA component/PTS system nitrogen regulatory IIA component
VRLTDFLVRQATLGELQATSKEGVIREMVGALCRAGCLPEGEAEAVVQAVLRREAMGSTGIGRGVAIPHAKHDAVGRVLGSLAVSPSGVPFDSLDGEPVHVVVLLMSPRDAAGAHLRTLEYLARRLGDDGFVRALRQAPSGEALWGLLEEAEKQP